MKSSLFHIFVAMLVTQTLCHEYCEFEPDGNFIPDPSDRRRYFYCSGGRGTPGECPVGQEFDPFDRVCDSAVRANPCEGHRDGTFLPDLSDRRRFIYCMQNMPIFGICDEGFEFDPADRVCDRVMAPTSRPQPTNRPQPTTSRPVVDPRNPCLNRPDGFFAADPSNRHAFFWCNGGVAFPSSCPNGEIFFEDGQFCDVEVTTRATTRRPVPVPTSRPVPSQRPVPTTRRPNQTTQRPVPSRPTVPARVTTTTKRPIPSRPSGK